MEFPFVRLAAHGGEFPMDCRICQTFTASPAEPGDLPEELEYGSEGDRRSWALTEDDFFAQAVQLPGNDTKFEPDVSQCH